MPEPPPAAVSLLVPVRNAATWAQSVVLPEQVPVLVSDSGSDDGTPDTLRNRGARVTVQPDEPGRVDNWLRALDLFRAEAEAGPWAKWLFAGDELDAAYLTAFQAEVARHPEARLVVSPYDFEEPDGRRVRSHGFLNRVPGFDQPRLVEPLEACRLTARHGNWFGPPLSQAIHRQALDPPPEPGDLPWVADMAIALAVARRHPVLWLPVSAGSFRTAERRHFHQHRDSPESILQTAILRYRAVEAAQAVGLGDRETASLRAEVDRHIIGELLQNGLDRQDARMDEALFSRFNRAALGRLLRYKGGRLFADGPSEAKDA
ncbi:MAG: hypothetical protein ACFE0O_07100 [Opitutales bacterium]